jgi:hypothetical protein
MQPLLSEEETEVLIQGPQLVSFRAKAASQTCSSPNPTPLPLQADSCVAPVRFPQLTSRFLCTCNPFSKKIVSHLWRDDSRRHLEGFFSCPEYMLYRITVVGDLHGHRSSVHLLSSQADTVEEPDPPSNDYRWSATGHGGRGDCRPWWSS